MFPSGVDVVVARYDESLDWIPSSWKQHVHVYNKGDTNYNTSGYKSVSWLPNVGRESHTYLTHLVRNYNGLADTVVFTQANPFDHCRNFVEKVTNLDVTVPFTSLGDWNIGIYDMYPRYHPSIKGRMDDVYDSLIGKKRPSYFEFSAGALFAVSRSAVMDRPVDTYTRALSYVDHDTNPDEGFVMERLWRLLLDKDYLAEVLT